MAGRRVLEVGLGYGTVAELLARAGRRLSRARHRRGTGGDGARRGCAVPGAHAEQVREGSALDLPVPDASFDRVVSIGCLHPTGDLSRAVTEARRVLRPGGELLLMVYNRHSARRVLLWPVLTARHRLVAGAPTAEAWLRCASDGTPAATRHRTPTSSAVGELRGLLYGMRDVTSTGATSTACRSGRWRSRGRG